MAAQAQVPGSPIQTRFDGGEISPRIAGRFDSELYKKALRQCSDFEPLPQGSLRMRSGSEKTQKLTGDSLTRLAQIRMSTGTDFLVELLDKKLHLYSLSGGAITPQAVSQAELIANGDFSSPNGAKWQALGTVGRYLANSSVIVQFQDFDGNEFGYAVLSNNVDDHWPVLYQRIVVPFNGTSHLQFDFSSNIAVSGGKLKVKISTSDPAGWADRVLGGGETWVYENTPPGLVGPGSGNAFHPPATWTHVDLGNIALNAGVYWISFQISTPQSHLMSIDNISLFTQYGVPSAEIVTPWSKLELADVRFVTETGRDRTVFVHPGHKPWALFYGGSDGVWTFGDVVFTSLPVAWGDAGSSNVPVGWSWQGQTTILAQANWPSAVDMHDGRLYYAGEPAQKNRILGSRSGSADDFTLGVNPGDALDFKLATKGAIRWLRSNRVMLAGTDLGQHSITGSKGTPLVGDIQARQESAFPSASVQAISVGTKALYVSSDLRRVRAAAFDFQTSGWESKDVTFAAEHITTDLIKELHHGWTPDSLIVMLLKSGKLALCTFEPVEQVIAFWTLNVNGVVCSASVSQGPLGAYLWMAVLRNGSVYLEKLHLSESTEVLRYLDSSISVVADGNGQIIGLDHLNGLTVRCVSGGLLLGDYAVVAGAAQLGPDNANATVIAGLAYKGTAVTLPRDSRTGKAHSSKLGVILNNSALPKLNGKRPQEKGLLAPKGTETLVTGKRLCGNLGWSDEDTVLIEQDLPFRTEICALYSDTKTEQEL